jgi:hypothetical protein
MLRVKELSPDEDDDTSLFSGDVKGEKNGYSHHMDVEMTVTK